VDKIFIEQSSSEAKVKVLIPMYEPLEVVKCKKCGEVIAEPKELIRIVKRWKNELEEKCREYANRHEARANSSFSYTQP